MQKLYHKNVLFLNPPCPSGVRLIRTFDCNIESKGHYIYQPYDFVLMSGNFSQEVEIDFWDCVINEINETEVLVRLAQNSYGTIFICIGENYFQSDLGLCKKIKTRFPLIKIVAFGAPFIEKSRREQSEGIVDFILDNPLEFIYDSELGITDEKGLLNSDEQLKAVDRKSPKSSTIRMPRHELFLDKKYRWPFIKEKVYTSVFINWGCPYSCSYCVLRKFPYWVRSAEEVISELRYVKSLGVKEIYFADRSFGLPTLVVKKVLEEMVNSKMNLKWSCYFHPNQFDRELVDLMARSGCHTIVVGVESNDLVSLKKYGRHVNGTKLEELVAFCHENKIKVCGDFIIGLSGETYEENLNKVQYAKKLKLDFASFNIASPLPGSVIRERAGESGADFEGFDSLGRDGALGNGLLTGSDLKKIRLYSVKAFYLRPIYLLKRLLNVSSFNELVANFREFIFLVVKSRG